MDPQITTALQQFYDWWQIKGSKLGQGDYQKYADLVKEAAKDVPVRKATLFKQYFRFGFDLFYIQFEGNDGYSPLGTMRDGPLLQHIFEDEKNTQPWWPVLDPTTKTYYKCDLSQITKVPPPRGSMPTDQYLERLLIGRRYFDAKAKNLLQAFAPYARKIKYGFDDDHHVYNRIKEWIPEFPDGETF